MNHFTDALKQYANFEGRATRTQYWYFFLFYLIFYIIAMVIDYVVFDKGMIVNGLYNIAVLIPSLAIGARRLHDIGKSGWWQLIGFIPLIGTIWLIVLLATDTVAGQNQYDIEPTTPVQTPTSTPVETPTTPVA